MEIHLSDVFIDTLFLPMPTDKIEETIAESLLSTEDKEIVKRHAYEQMKAESFDAALTLNCGTLVIALIKPNPKRPSFPWRNVCGGLYDIAVKYRIESLAIDATQLTAEQCGAMTDGMILSEYNYKDSLNKKECSHSLVFLNADEEQEKVINLRKKQAEAANLARFIADSPANMMTPEHIAKQAEEVADKHDLSITVLDEKEMQQAGMGALLSVSQGSAHEARLIALEYHHPKAKKTLALVGKGLTFDAGGVCLKPGKGMSEMKYDKSGGAAVLSAMQSIAELEPEINVIGIIPASENVTGSNAFKPGDVVKACNGKTIEIINTDAEGRLILCDALAWTAKKYQPDKMVNIATLTGAVIRSLGHGIAAVAGNSDDVCQGLVAAGNNVDERVWQLPICDVHEELLKSDFADLANVADSGEASLMNGTAFLQEFVGDTPWAAIDIGGTAWRYRGASYIKGTGASGFGSRLLCQWVLNESQND